MCILAPSRTAWGTWFEQVSNSPQGLRVVHAVSSDVAWAVGNGGQVVVSVDGGSNWLPRVVPGAGNLRGLFAFNGQTSVVADQMGRFWLTSNGGIDWIQVYEVSGSSINGIHFFDAENGWAMGDPVEGRFVILESADGGSTWTRSPVAPPASAGMAGRVRSYDWVGNQIGVFGTNRWVVWRTTNGGGSWDSVRTHIEFISGVELSNSGIGLASGTVFTGGSFLDRSTDFGQTWYPIEHPSQATPLRNFDWIEGTSEVWGATNQTGVFQSTNGGLDWMQFILAPPAELSVGDLDFVDSDTGWCVGERNPGTGPGRIFKYSRSAGIEVARGGMTPVPVRAYPNPFATSIAFVSEMASGEPPEISIYDVEGRHIWTAGDAGAMSGHLRWDGRDRSGRTVGSGVYLVRIRSGMHESTGRIVKEQ